MNVSVKPLPSEDLDLVLTHTEQCWEEARGCRFFITGGTGFFGMWLLESFTHINSTLGLNMQAVVLTRDATAFARKAPHLTTRPDLQFLEGDVRSFSFPKEKIDYVIHAATEASAKLNNETPSLMLDTIIQGTNRVLKLSAQSSIKKLLLVSSGAVYGKQPSELTHIPEDFKGAPDPLQPGSAYGIGKLVAEHMCSTQARQHGYEVKIARCFAFVGPHLPLDSHFAIGNFIRDALAGEPINIKGDGSPTRSYLYAADLAVWLWTLLFRGDSNKAYNVGSDESLSIKKIAKKTTQSISSSSKISIALKPKSDLNISRYVPSTETIRNDLKLHQITTLKSAINKTAIWYRCKI